MVDCASTFFAGGFRPPAGREGVEEDVVAGVAFVGSDAAVCDVSLAKSLGRDHVRGLFSCLLVGSVDEGTSAVLVVASTQKYSRCYIPPQGESSIFTGNEEFVFEELVKLYRKNESNVEIC